MSKNNKKKNLHLAPLQSTNPVNNIERPLPQNYYFRAQEQDFHSAMHSFAQEESDFSFKDIISAIARRWKLLATTVLASILLVGTYCLLQDSLYSATATIEIRGYAPVLAGAQVENLYGTDTRKLEYQKTTIAKLKRPSVADRVLGETEIRSEFEKYFNIRKIAKDGTISTEPANKNVSAESALVKKVGQKSSQDIAFDPTQIDEAQKRGGFTHSQSYIDKYLSLIEVNPVSETSLVEISVTSKNPAFSAKIADAHATAFIDELRTERKESMESNLLALQKQATTLKTRLGESDAKLAAYAEENGLISASGDTDDLEVQGMLGISNLLTEATAKRVKSENLLKQLRSVDADEATTLDDESIRDLQNELEKLQSEYRGLSSKLTAEYPSMLDLKGQIDSLKQSIAQQRKRLIKGHEIQVESDKAAEKKLGEQLEEIKTKAFANSKLLARYSVMYKESQSLRSLFETVLKQLQETQISAAGGTSNIIVSDYAQIPSKPSFPKTKLMVFVAALAGLGLGLTLILFLELFDSRIRSKEETEKSIRLPVLGSLPDFSDNSLLGLPESKLGFMKQQLSWSKDKGEKKTNDLERSLTVKEKAPARRLITIANPTTMVAEALRTVRASLMLASVDDPAKVIMLTSAEKGAGKTTIAANLAVALAQADCKTILVDCDLRQSCLVSLFPEIADKKGLSECLAGLISRQDATISTSVKNLSVISTGTCPPSPAELIGSKRMQELLETLKENYDYVIIDAPPVLPVADSLMLSRGVDSVILVAREGKTLSKHLKETKRRLQTVRARISGIILNGSDSGRGEIYGGRENSFYFNSEPAGSFPKAANM